MKKLFSIILLISALTYAKSQPDLDTNKYVIFQDGDVRPNLFQPQPKFISLTKDELSQIERLLKDAIRDYNAEAKKHLDSVKRTSYYDSLKGFFKFVIDSWKPISNLSKYKRQLISGINYWGDKEVWINCFKPEPYSGRDSEAFSFQKDWRKKIISVDGGGSNYFNITVDLTKNKYRDLRINGPM